MRTKTRIIDFNNWCFRCKNKNNPATNEDDPCCVCMDVPARTDTDVPIKFKTDEKIEKQGRSDIKKIGDYLYTTRYFKEFDYEKAEQWCKERYLPQPSGCTGVRFNNYHMRNFDFPYSDYASFLIFNQAVGDRFASAGMTGGSLPITPNMISSGKDSEYYNMLPFLQVDGINENGVCIQINMVNPGDYGSTTGTNPGKPDLCTAMVVRYVLDYAVSATDAVRMLSQRNIWAPQKGDYAFEYHWLISDIYTSYIVEINDNRLVCKQYDRNDRDCIMTNFYQHDMIHKNGIIDRTTVPLHSAGIERWELAYDILNNHNPYLIAEKLKYSQTYKRNNKPFWYSEYNGDYRSKPYKVDLTVLSPEEDYYTVVQAGINNYKVRTRSDHKTWWTVHSIVYDLHNLSIMVAVQEDYNNWYPANIHDFL